jgi:transposase
VLVELSVMEQRYQAVLAVIQDGWRVVEVAERLGVSRQSVHAWIARYERGGLAALADRSHRPSACSHQIPAQTEALICELRREHPGWGARRIEHQLAKRGIEPVPGRSSIYRCLRRHGLVELRRRLLGHEADVATQVRRKSWLISVAARRGGGMDCSGSRRRPDFCR